MKASSRSAPPTMQKNSLRLESVPTADSYIMKCIIHDRKESKAITILTNCAKSMHSNGKILPVECLIKGSDVHDFGKPWIS